MDINQNVMRIGRIADIENSHALRADLDSIFFESSATRSFASDAARDAFRHKWLGSYLIINPHEAFLAITPDNRVAGYIVGSLDDPNSDPRYADLGYFVDFAHLTRSYPAHLHINVAARHRSGGIGAMLLETFVSYAASTGSPGVHVVTGKGMRNVGFYQRNGFLPLAEAPWRTGAVVMLGRRLG